MPIVNGSNVQVTFFYEHFSQTLMNVTNWYVVDGGTLGEMSELQAIADYFANFANPLRPAALTINCLPETVTFLRVRAQVTNPTRTAFREQTVNQTGGRGSSLSANFDAVITKRTDRSGRSRQGNFFLPGISSTDMLDGELLVAFKTALELNMDWLFKRQTVAVGAPVLDPVIFHRAGGGSDVITSIAVQDQVRVMTRRTVGRGI